MIGSDMEEEAKQVMDKKPNNQLAAMGLVLLVGLLFGFIIGQAVNQGEDEDSKDLISFLDPATGQVEETTSDQLQEALEGIEERSRDNERKTDINAIHTQVEVYYSDNGHYPTTAQLSSLKWVTKNLPGLDTEALVDPSSIVAEYAYVTQPADCGAETCQAYTLTADLEEDGLSSEDSDGNIFDYQKYSLN